MNAAQEEDIPDAFKCGFTGELMKDPVVTAYGHYFERSVLVAHLHRCNVCPITKKPLLPHMVWREPSLSEAIKEFRVMASAQERLAALPLAPSEVASRSRNSREDLHGSAPPSPSMSNGGTLGRSSSGGSVIKRRKRRRSQGPFKRGGTDSTVQPEIKYYNHQLLNRRDPSPSVPPTRNSLSSSSFASKLLKAASRPAGTPTSTGENRGVQWLWRGPDSWNVYRQEDNTALEEGMKSGPEHSVFVDQGRAFVNIADRVHVCLSNGRRFHVIRGTWFLASTSNQVLPFSEHVAEQLEQCFTQRKLKERIKTEMDTVVIMEGEHRFVEYAIEDEALIPTKRRVERGFCFQSIT